MKVRAVLFYFRDRSSEGNRADFEIGSLDELESVLETLLGPLPDPSETRIDLR